MALDREVGAIILGPVEQSPDCYVEKLTEGCLQARGNQVVLFLDNLSHARQVTPRQQGPGRYKVGLAPHRDSLRGRFHHNITPNAVTARRRRL